MFFLGHADATGCDRKACVRHGWRRLEIGFLQTNYVWTIASCQGSKENLSTSCVCFSHDEHQENDGWLIDGSNESWEIWGGRFVCFTDRFYFFLSLYLRKSHRYVLDSNVFLAHKSRGWVHVLMPPRHITRRGQRYGEGLRVINSTHMTALVYITDFACYAHITIRLGQIAY